MRIEEVGWAAAEAGATAACRQQQRPGCSAFKQQFYFLLLKKWEIKAPHPLVCVNQTEFGDGSTVMNGKVNTKQVAKIKQKSFGCDSHSARMQRTPLH